MEGYTYKIERFADNAWKVVRSHPATNKSKTVVWIVQREDKTYLVVADSRRETIHKDFDNKKNVCNYLNELKAQGDI